MHFQILTQKLSHDGGVMQQNCFYCLSSKKSTKKKHYKNCFAFERNFIFGKFQWFYWRKINIKCSYNLFTLKSTSWNYYKITIERHCTSYLRRKNLYYSSNAVVCVYFRCVPIAQCSICYTTTYIFQQQQKWKQSFKISSSTSVQIWKNMTLLPIFMRLNMTIYVSAINFINAFVYVYYKH